MSDAAAVQKFFLEEVQLGETYLTQGNRYFLIKINISLLVLCFIIILKLVQCPKAHFQVYVLGLVIFTSNSLIFLCFFVSFFGDLLPTPLFLGDYDNTVKHLTNAIAVCGQPQQLLQLFKSTLPPAVFQMLLDNLDQLKIATEQVRPHMIC